MTTFNIIILFIHNMPQIIFILRPTTYFKHLFVRMFELKIKIYFYNIIFCNIFIFLKLAYGNIKSRFLFIFLIEILWVDIMIDNFDSFLFLEVIILLINH